MRERAEAFGGTITIGSYDGKGTNVEAIIPTGNTTEVVALLGVGFREACTALWQCGQGRYRGCQPGDEADPSNS